MAIKDPDKLIECVEKVLDERLQSEADIRALANEKRQTPTPSKIPIESIPGVAQRG